MNKAGGNVTLVAKAFGVQRHTVYDWMKVPEYKQVLDDARGMFLDEAIASARVLVRGIPEIQNGKQVGYIVPPNPMMVKYVCCTLGRSEGFGENLDVTTNGESLKPKCMTPEEARDFLALLEREY